MREVVYRVIKFVTAIDLKRLVQVRFCQRGEGVTGVPPFTEKPLNAYTGKSGIEGIIRLYT